jgi:hypothetical protein
MLDADNEDNEEEGGSHVIKEKNEYIPTRLQRIMEEYEAGAVTTSDDIPEISRSFEEITSLDEFNET